MNVRALGAWITTGLALWVSLGVLDVTDTAARTTRVAMLPPLALLAASIALAVLAGWVLQPRRPAGTRTDAVLPLYALAVLVLPYLPWLPDALPVLQVFAGPARYFVWLAVIAQTIWSALGSLRARLFVARIRGWSPLRNLATVFAVSLFVCGLAAAVVAPSGIVPGGDEPHYLILTQSLILDRDLAIENNHQRGDYREYYGDELDPHALARGVDGALYSVHPIGLPLLIAPAFAAGGYPAVVLMMLVLAAAAATLAWHWVRSMTGSVSAATFAWAATTLSVSFLFSAGTVYPEIAAALAVMLAFSVGLGRPASGKPRSVPDIGMWRALVLSLAAASLPWLSSKYAPMSAAIIAAGAWRLTGSPSPARPGRGYRFAAMLAPYAASLAAWFWFFYATWGSPWPSAAYGGAAHTQMSLANLGRGVPGLLFDQEYGLLAYAPILVIAALGWWHHLREGGAARRLAVESAVPFLLLLATVAGHTMWWGGTSVPARFLVSGILLLALPVAWEYRRAASLPDRRAAYRMLLLIGVTASVTVLVSPGVSALANRRDGVSRLLQWVSPDWHLWAFAPDFIMLPPLWGLAQTAIWIACLGGSALVFYAVLGRPQHLAASRIGRGLAFLRADAALLTAILLVTLITPPVMGSRLKPDVGPEDRARIRLLDSFDPHARPLAIHYAPLARVDAAAVPSLFALSARPAARRPPQAVPVLFNARFALPAGRYELTLLGRSGESRLLPAGNLMLQGGRHGGSLASWLVAGGAPRWQDTFDLPVDVGFLAFQAAPALAESIGELRLRPLRVMPMLDRTAAYDILGSSVLGDRFVFLFHDGASYPEAGGFWVRGNSRASISVLSRTGRLTLPVQLRLRNGPTANVIRIITPGDVTAITIGPGETRDVRIAPTPLDGTLRMIVNPERGFVPSKTEPGNRDDRFLGCWVEVVG